MKHLNKMKCFGIFAVVIMVLVTLQPLVGSIEGSEGNLKIINNMKKKSTDPSSQGKRSGGGGGGGVTPPSGVDIAGQSGGCEDPINDIPFGSYLPDLVGDFFNVTADSLETSDSFMVEFEVLNDGDEDVEAGDAFTVAFYLSFDDVIEAQDFWLGEFTVVGGLPADTSTGVLDISLVLPAYDDPIWIGTGQYFVGMIIDSEQVINELFENNNQNTGFGQDVDSVEVIIVFPDLPDLSGCWFNATQDTVAAGGSFTVEYEIQNTGFVDADAFNISFFISYNADISDNDRQLGEWRVSGGLPMGQILQDQQLVQLPFPDDVFWYGSGEYYAGMIVDSEEELDETDETNNRNRGLLLDKDIIFVEGTANGGYGLVDLDVDSDNNEGIFGPERSDDEDNIEEDNPGKFIILNEDDDDGFNETTCMRALDKLQDGRIAGEDDLAPLILDIKPGIGLDTGTGKYLNFTFEIPQAGDRGKIRLWRSQDRGVLNEDNITIGEEYKYQQVWMIGDLNGDGNFDDIIHHDDSAWFENCLSNPIFIEIWTEFVECDYDFLDVADVNDDGEFTTDDWDAYNYSRDNNIIRYVSVPPLTLWIEGLKAWEEVDIQVGVTFYHDGGSSDTEFDVIRLRVGSGQACFDKYCTSDTPLHRRWYGIPPGYDGDDNDPYSRCWKFDYDPGCRSGGYWLDQLSDQPSGFPLNLALPQGFGPGDYPPKHTDPVLSSAPMVSKAVNYFMGPNPYAERPAHNDLVDMITGVPLYQRIDFELPFGGSTFRHTRTYSENPVDSLFSGFDGPVGEGGCPGDRAITSSWDWNGLFWMMSENPILLIDARYPEIVNHGDRADRYCYFIPDAHHAIPFHYLSGTNNYVSPDWFDAILMHNGNISTETGNWTTLPTEFYIWLNHNTIKYTFKVHYEDVPFQNIGTSGNELWIDSHNPLPLDADGRIHGIPDESDEGWGVPFYGLVTNITDSYGNTMEYEYCDFYQYECDNISTENCTEICQNANEKGQLKTIRLKTSDGTVAWTLLYVHRAFAAKGRNNYYFMGRHYPEEIFNQNMLHAIYVYEGDVVTSQFQSLTLGSTNFTDLNSFDDYDNIDVFKELGLQDGEHEWIDNWVIETKYMYEENDLTYYTEADSSTAYYNYSTTDDPDGNQWDDTDMSVGYNLLKTTVTRQSCTDGTDTKHSSHTIYRYAHNQDKRNILFPHSNGNRYLEAVFYDSAIDTIVEAKEQELGYDLNENILFELRRSATIILNDPDTYIDENRSVLDLADINMSRWTTEDIMDFEDPGGWTPDYSLSLWGQLITNISSEFNKTVYNVAGVKTLTDNRADSEQGGRFSYYLFRTYPVMQWDDECDINFKHGRLYHTEYHHPYQYLNWTNPPDTSDYTMDRIPWDQPFFNIVIDEHVIDENGTDLYDPADKDDDGKRGIHSRRIVKMNAPGFILYEILWVFDENETGHIVKRVGTSEKRWYDENGRVTMLGTIGWGCEENQQGNPEENGLVYTYTYGENYEFQIATLQPSGKITFANISLIGEVETISVMKGNGSSQTPYIVKLFDRSYQCRPELFNRSIVFPDSVPLDSIRMLDGSFYEENITRYGDVTEYIYGFKEAPGSESGYWDIPITNRTVIQPAIPQTADGPDVRAADISIVNNDGNTIWHMYGNINERGASAEHFFLDYNEYDNKGRLIKEVKDADTDYYNEKLPLHLYRNSGISALNLTTIYGYDATYGINHTWYYDEYGQLIKEQIIVFKEGHDYFEKWTYNDLVRRNGGWTVLSPATIERSTKEWHSIQTLTPKYTIYDDPTADPFDFYQETYSWYTLKPDYIKKIVFNETYHYTEPNGNENYTVISTTSLSYDPNGRITELKAEGQEDDASVSTYITYHATGKPMREQAYEGTITRKVYNQLGYLWKTYQGTNDIHPFWKTACPPGSDCEYCECDSVECCDYPDNMRLIEKRYYGNGTNDTYKLVAVRHYLEKPQNQYWLFNVTLGAFDPEPNEDDIGWLEQYEYDWRMRNIYEQTLSFNGQILQQKFKWLDNLDRIILEAVYGSDPALVPVHVDPRRLSPGWNLTRQNITDILNAPVKPLSLTETVYNARNKVEEVCNYDILSGVKANYTSSLIFYDHNGNQIETHNPGSAIQKSIYDAKKRLISSISLVNTSSGDIEITRTNTTHDYNDRAIKKVNWERKHNAPIEEKELTDQNSVKAYTFNWYNKSGKIICTARYGTNSSTYTTGNDPYPDCPNNYPEDPHMISFPQEALVKWFEYDDAGRQNATINPDGTVIRTEFDNLDRQILVTENADDPDLNMRRHTAYCYNSITGQLEMMAAVLPDHIGHDGIEGIKNWSDINWEADDSTIQITTFEYNAVVINGTWDISAYCNGWTPSGSNWEGNSRHNGWISKVIYPNGDWLKFTYYSDGLVASRTDSKNITFYYVYDELGRLNTTYVNDRDFYLDACQVAEFVYAPSNRTQKIVYGYNADGMMSVVTAYTYTSGIEEIVSQNKFEYDGRGNLIGEWQSHFGLVNADTPSVRYSWEFSNASCDNYDRLQTMMYPVSDREIMFNYGDSDSLDNALCRITSLEDSNFGKIADYTYMGLSNRISTLFGNGVNQSFYEIGDTGYSGLDQFSRVINLHFRDDSGETVHQYQYGYDKNSNRLFANVTQANGHDNDRSYLYKYDKLNRLVNASMGILNGDHTRIIQDLGVSSQNTSWLLDNLGNWAGGTQVDGSMIKEYYDGDGALIDNKFSHHNVNIANQITNITTNIIGTGSGSGGDYIPLCDEGDIPIDPTLKAYWRFDDGSGQVAADSSGNGNDGQLGEFDYTDPRDPIWRPTGGKIHGALEFNPNQVDYVVVPHDNSIDFSETDSFTVAAWVYIPAQHPVQWQGVVTKGRDQDGWYGIWVNNNDRWCFGSRWHTVIGDEVIDGWQHVAIVLNGSTDNRSLYIDGTLSNYLPDTTDWYSNTGDLFIGAAKVSESYYECFKGRIDEVYIYDRALNKSEIEDLMSIVPPVAVPGGPYAADENVLITFDASDSYDPDGNIVGYRWDFNCDGEWDTNWLSEPTIRHSFCTAGNHLVRLEVRDDDPIPNTDDEIISVTIYTASSSEMFAEVVYDRAGNLVFDGVYLYLYDGFNRLMSVYHPGGDLTFDVSGRFLNGQISKPIVSYVYDGLGRLIQKKSPTENKSYYSDGVRRLVECDTSGSSSCIGDFNGDGAVGLSDLAQLLGAYGKCAEDPDYLPEADFDDSGCIDLSDLAEFLGHYGDICYIQGSVDREYIYGPEYVDEFIAQVNATSDLIYMLQDANYNVMALLDDQGVVLEQYQYDPYASLAIVDPLVPTPPINCVGHQGLFFDSFEGEGLTIDAVGLYYNRNRWYSPTLGRFMQRDPNEAAQPIITALMMNGQTMNILFGVFNPEGHYSDGMNLYQYCGSNPVNNRDPSGTLFGETYIGLAVLAVIIILILISILMLAKAICKTTSGAKGMYTANQAYDKAYRLYQKSVDLEMSGDIDSVHADEIQDSCRLVMAESFEEARDSLNQIVDNAPGIFGRPIFLPSLPANNIDACCIIIEKIIDHLMSSSD